MADAVLGVTQLGVLFVHLLLVLALEGKVFLLGLEDALVLDFFAFNLGLFQNLVPLSLEDGAADQYVRSQCNHCTDYESYNYA